LGTDRGAEQPPDVFINARAVGFYDSQSEAIQTEECPPGDDFLAKLASQWEEASRLQEGSATRHVAMRIGLVLSPEGGALKKMLPIFRWGLGGPIGGGRQGAPWIHMEDLIGLFLFALERPVRGPLNAVAPECLDQKTFARTLGEVLHRPAILPLPAFVLRMALGEQADLLLKSPWAAPKRPVELGYIFRHPRLKEALLDLLKSPMAE